MIKHDDRTPALDIPLPNRENGQALYAQKWQKREAINAATSREEVLAISTELGGAA